MIDPYFLGLLLGGGCLSCKTSIGFSTVDAELVESIESILAQWYPMLSIKPRGGCNYAISNLSGNGGNSLRSAISDLKLIGLKSYEKFIPSDYLFNSVDVRIEILRGLMDTDGWVSSHRSGRSRAQFSTTSERLADDVVLLVQSLGGIASKRERVYGDDDFHIYKNDIIRHARNSFVLEIILPSGLNPFRLRRKNKKSHSPVTPVRLISSIEAIGKKPCQCIRVEADDHLYITDGCVITHNTFDDAVTIFDEAQNATYGQIKLFLTRIGENSKMIINGDPEQSDLPGPVALVEVAQRISDVVGVGVVNFYNDSIVRHSIIGKLLDRL